MFVLTLRKGLMRSESEGYLLGRMGGLGMFMRVRVRMTMTMTVMGRRERPARAEEKHGKGKKPLAVAVKLDHHEVTGNESKEESK